MPIKDLNMQTTDQLEDDTDGLAGSETELRQLMSRLERASKDYGMEISGYKKLMTNNNNGMPTYVQIAGTLLIDEVQSFKSLGAIISEESPKRSPESLK